MRVNFITKPVQPLIKRICKPKNTLPMVAVPMLLYDVKNDNVKKLFNMMAENDIEIPKFLNVNPLTNSGLDAVSKTKIRNAIYEAARNGKIDNSTKNKLLSKVNFTGNPDSAEQILQNTDVAINDGMDLIDTTLPDSLKDFFDKDGLDVPEGLLDTVNDVVATGADALGDAIDGVKKIVEKIGDLIL